MTLIRIITITILIATTIVITIIETFGYPLQWLSFAPTGRRGLHSTSGCFRLQAMAEQLIYPQYNPNIAPTYYSSFHFVSHYPNISPIEPQSTIVLVVGALVRNRPSPQESYDPFVCKLRASGVQDPGLAWVRCPNFTGIRGTFSCQACTLRLREHPCTQEHSYSHAQTMMTPSIDSWAQKASPRQSPVS